MPTIVLSQGKEARVSTEDFAPLSRYKWYAYRAGAGLFYAGRTVYREDGTSRILQMHTAILGKYPGMEIDHRNKDGLDNRRCNIHFVTHAMNCRNRRKIKKTSSRYIGVSYDKKQKKWRAYVKTNGMLIHLGMFATEKKAYAARTLANNILLALQ